MDSGWGKKKSQQFQKSLGPGQLKWGKNYKDGVGILGETGKIPKDLPGSPHGKEREFTSYLDKPKCGPWGQDDVLIGELILHVLLQTLFFVDFPIVHHTEECPGRYSNGDGMLGFGLQRRSRKRESTHAERGRRCNWKGREN